MKNRNLPSGTRDEFGALALIKENIENKLFSQFKKHGFVKLTTPVLEYADVFRPLKLSNYRPYQMLDQNGRNLVLRPDMTLPIARVLSTTDISLPIKVYYGGDVFRLKKQLSGGYNQISQAGIEIIGYKELKAEWECLLIGINSCRRLGIKNLEVEIGYARFVDEILKILPLPNSIKISLKESLFAKNMGKYQQLCLPLKNSPFNAFLSEWPWLFGNFTSVINTVYKFPKLAPLKPIISSLKKTFNFLKRIFPQQNLNLDLSSPSTQSYYTGTTFQAFTKDSNDYLFSGGRYDNLLKNFQNLKKPAVGLAFDIDVLAKHLSLPREKKHTLIYFRSDQWKEAEKKVQEIPNSSLCLSNSLVEAKRIALSLNYNLLNLDRKTQRTK